MGEKQQYNVHVGVCMCMCGVSFRLGICTIKRLEYTVQYFYSVFYLTMLLIDKII